MAGLISIILPFKNTSQYLKDCIESIGSQSESDWELLAVNDHSNDSSKVIAMKFAKKDKRIKVFDNLGSGIIDALKTGYSQSSGEYIHRMDSDDIMPQNKLEILKKKLVKSGEGFVATGKVKYFCENEVSSGYLDYEKWLNGLCENNNHWENIYHECVIASPAWMIHRNDLEKCGAFESELYPEDYDLIFRMFKGGMKVVAAKEVVHLWREHPNRTSRTHEHYNQKSFFRLKIHYFLKLQRNPGKQLYILGAGNKGKMVHDILKEHKINHQWLGKNEYEKSMELIRSVLHKNSNQVIILFSDEKSQMKTKNYFESLKMIENKDYFFFR